MISNLSVLQPHGGRAGGARGRRRAGGFERKYSPGKHKQTMATSLLDKEILFANAEFGLDKRLVCNWVDNNSIISISKRASPHAPPPNPLQSKGTSKMGFIYPTLVQTKFIPLALAGKDILAR
jgi:superfamily II DNA/RNA helicase